MSVPDHSYVIRKLYDTGLYDLHTEDGQGAFEDSCVATLNGIDENWRHLKKSKAQTNIHRHGEDSALYLLPNNRAMAVDFIGGSGGPNPRPGWIVDEVTPYTHADAHDPDDHGIDDPPPPPQLRIPSYGELGDDAFFRENIGKPLQSDMAAAGQALNDGSSVWFSRTTYELLTEALKAGKAVDPAPIVLKYRNQWRAILGQPPL
jgi:hypothetical protein